MHLLGSTVRPIGRDVRGGHLERELAWGIVEVELTPGRVVGLESATK
jgi:hypothetical protein